MSGLVIRGITRDFLHLLAIEFFKVINFGGDRVLRHYTENMAALGTTDSDSFGRNP